MIGSSITSSGNDGVEGPDSMNGTVGNGHDGDSSADAVVHDEVKCEIFDEEGAVVGEGSAEQSMEHSVAGSVSDGACSVGLF